MTSPLTPASVPTPPAAGRIDLSKCQQEPIHIPDAIQPGGGVLLVLQPQGLALLQASANAQDLLDPSQPVETLLGQSLHALVPALAGQVERQLSAMPVGKPLPPFEAHLPDGARVDVMLYRQGGADHTPPYVLMELEPLLAPAGDETGEANTEDDDNSPYALQAFIQAIYHCQTVDELMTVAVAQIQQLSGFGRVMAYRFHEDWHGEVIAERQAHPATEDNSSSNSYLGLHFPASDIPAQARALYFEAPLRLIREVSNQRVPMVPAQNPLTQAPLDMTAASLRATSATHVLYLQALGVRASMSIAIRNRDALWGLLVCHHPTPRSLSARRRAMCELLGHVISLQLANITQQQAMAERLQKKDWMTQLAAQLSLQNLDASTQPLSQLLGLQGGLLRLCPPYAGGPAPVDIAWGELGSAAQDALPAIVQWVEDALQQAPPHATVPALFTSCFAQTLPQALPHVATAYTPQTLLEVGGVLCLPLLPGCFFVGVRPEWVQTLAWHCTLTQDALPKRAVPLGPEFSCRRWQESVRGHAKAWTPLDLELASQLRSALLERLHRLARQQHARQLEGINAHLAQELQERKALESQLVQAQKMESLGQLAAGVAHEINNPIGYIKSNLTMLADYIEVIKRLFAEYRAYALAHGADAPGLKTLEAKFKREDAAYILEDLDTLIEESRAGSERVREIVYYLTNFVRLDEDAWQAVNLNEGLESTLRILWNDLKYKCHVRREFSPLPLLRCNAGHINQVAMNLLLNAAQAIPEEGGHIVIKTWATHRDVCLSVSDTGTGIAPEHLHRIFDPFFTTKPVGQGTGLGLTISYNIVKKHGGLIQVDSAAGVGSTFTVILPLDGPPEHAPHQPALAPNEEAYQR
jgi:light-regulated signal transduction histidine kinase (bacteriophytochrome)